MIKTTIIVHLVLQLLLLALSSDDNGSNSETQRHENSLENESLEWDGQQPRQQTMILKGSSQNAQNCPRRNPWFLWNNKTKTCHCGSGLHGVVQCNADTNELAVMDCHCLTVEHYTTGPAPAVAGNCPFNCVNFTHFNKNQMYHSGPSDCASLNRQGTLCGQCLDGYAVGAYSYDFKCIRCNRELENWGLYIVFAFLPPTVFVIITMVFRINALSPHLNMFVFAAQLLTAPAIVRIFLLYTSQNHASKIFRVVSQISIAIHAIWNLDFVRVNALPNVCMNATTLNILVLDYLIAIYPLILIVVSYVIFELHRSSFKPVLYILKPLHMLLARFRRQWGMQTTIMDTFVTFFFLSTTKFLSVSFGLLVHTIVYKPDGKIHSVNLYYDPTIKYFGKEHGQYVLMAITILILFIAFPLSLLFCYQCKAYRKCLTRCKIRGSVLDEFVDTFQRYYKDQWDTGLQVVFRIPHPFKTIGICDICSISQYVLLHFCCNAVYNWGCRNFDSGAVQRGVCSVQPDQFCSSFVVCTILYNRGNRKLGNILWDGAPPPLCAGSDSWPFASCLHYGCNSKPLQKEISRTGTSKYSHQFSTRPCTGQCAG
jgi:hypothetical protein